MKMFLMSMHHVFGGHFIPVLGFGRLLRTLGYLVLKLDVVFLLQRLIQTFQFFYSVGQ